MKIKKNNKGFTLLEIIIVIIIIGVLASLALPRMFTMVEFSRSAEAFASIASIRSAMERCYLMQNGSYRDCWIGGGSSTLDIDDPSDAPNSHFNYVAQGIIVPPYDRWFIIAYRNTLDGGGGPDDYIAMHLSPVSIARSGNGVFSSIK